MHAAQPPSNVEDAPPETLEDPRPQPSAWQQARRRRLKAVLAALVTLLAAGGATLGAIAVPTLSWVVSPEWYSTLLTVLILTVLAPGILLAGAGSLVFGITVGWPRSRWTSNAIMIGVGSIFAGLWLLPAFGLAEQHVAYVVVGGTLGLTFLVAPAVGGMMVRGVIGEG